MKDKRIDALEVWKQVEDVLTPRLRLSPIERAVYLHLLRHSHLEGKRRERFSIYAVARRLNLSHGPVRRAVRRLVELRALRLAERTKAGHLVYVRLPEQVPGTRADKMGSSPATWPDRAPSLENVDFLRTRSLRHAIHARERGMCFYCLRRIRGPMKCLDHVVPRVRFGRNSYRNLVSSCLECNSGKSERSASDFLRSLYREGRLTAAELRGCLRALRALAAGKLRPAFPKAWPPAKRN